MILAVAGGKGGVGKSTVSLNLGHELDAIVVDTDLAIPDLPRGDGPDLHDVLAGRVSPMEGVREVGPVRLLSSGRTLEGASAADLTGLEDAVETIHRKSEHVVVDCPAGLARDVGTAIATADSTVLVTTPKAAALENAGRIRRLAVDLEAPIGAVVVNKVSGNDDEAEAERIEEELMAPAVSIERASAVADSQEAGKPVEALHPDAPAVDRFEELAWLLTDTEQERREDGDG